MYFIDPEFSSFISFLPALFTLALCKSPATGRYFRKIPLATNQSEAGVRLFGDQCRR